MPDCILQIQHPGAAISEENELPRPLPHPQPPPEPLPLESTQHLSSSHNSYYNSSPHVRFQDQPQVKVIPQSESLPQRTTNSNFPPTSTNTLSQHKQPQIAPVNPSQPLPPPKLQQSPSQQHPQHPHQFQQAATQTSNTDFQQRKFEQQFQMQLNKHTQNNAPFSQAPNVFSSSLPPQTQSHNLFSASLPLSQPSKPAELPRRSLTDSIPPSSFPSPPTPLPTHLNPRVSLFPPSLQRAPLRSSPSPPRRPLSPRKPVEILDTHLVVSEREPTVREKPYEPEVKGKILHTLL